MRDDKGRWLKGTAGNTTGSGSRGISHVRELARQHTQSAIETLAAIMQDDSKKDAARVAAAEALLDRAWGKPTQPVDHGGEGFSLVLHLGGRAATD